MNIALQKIAQLSFLIFIITNILSAGLSVTLQQILQPFRQARLLITALLINFVVIPLLMGLLVYCIPLAESTTTGLMILATAAGAPFLPKLTQNAKGSLPFAVGLMVILMATTVPVMPLILPMLLPGVEVRSSVIIQPLVLLIALPLGAGMLITATKKPVAQSLQPVINRASNIALVLGLMLGLGLEAGNLIRLLNFSVLSVTTLFVLGSLGLGYLSGGSEPAIQRVLGLGTAQRNVSAALLVGGASFDDPAVVSVILASSLLMLGLLLLFSWMMGRQILK